MSEVGPQSRKQAMRRKRRLITLISAGRNRIVMIRRELPRTEDADWTVKSYRTKHTRVLLPRAGRPAACFVTRTGFIGLTQTKPLHTCHSLLLVSPHAPPTGPVKTE